MSGAGGLGGKGFDQKGSSIAWKSQKMERNQDKRESSRGVVMGFATEGGTVSFRNMMSCRKKAKITTLSSFQ